VTAEADLRSAFDAVTEAMESYFEGYHGPEVGMSVGGFIRAYRDVLAHADESEGRVERLRQLDPGRN
jgi:hypothetical protein